MKEWQCGYELEYLRKLEAFYAPHNKFAISPFAEFKKNNIAEHLRKKTLHFVTTPDNHPVYDIFAAYVAEEAKVMAKITMFGNTIIGEKFKGDITLSRLVGNPHSLLEVLHPNGKFGDKNCWLVTFAGNKEVCALARLSGFNYVGYKVTSFSEVMAVFFRDNPLSFQPRQHPKVNPAELVGMKKLCDVPQEMVALYPTILDKLKKFEFANHYSNYNKKKAWSAISLRGYHYDPRFIEKPSEMNNAWHAEHKGEWFELQDTEVYTHFPEVRQLLSFLDGDIHRVRFMKLTPGGGELLRHTDQVDPDAGNSIGALARLHFPIQTNKDVLFTTWNERDEPVQYHYGFGECWIIDTRKPHMAKNGGIEERIHLVVDTIVTPKLEKLICENNPQ